MSKRCRQQQCSYFIQGGCKPCDTCGEKEYELNEECPRCHACENIPNNTRFDEDTKITSTVTQMEKETTEEDYEKAELEKLNPITM